MTDFVHRIRGLNADKMMEAAPDQHQHPNPHLELPTPNVLSVAAMKS
jgi:hypothetical protein